LNSSSIALASDIFRLAGLLLLLLLLLLLQWLPSASFAPPSCWGLVGSLIPGGSDPQNPRSRPRSARTFSCGNHCVETVATTPPALSLTAHEAAQGITQMQQNTAGVTAK
jgi:hypothetical protein